MSSAFTIRTSALSIEHVPMQHLFSPTALDHDLTYVDKTYYDASRSTEQKSANEKQSSTNIHAMVLNKTINLVNSISRLDLRNIGLFVLPTQVSLLTRLTLLDLSHNNLAKLPSSMDQLRHLKHLNISHNRLHHLPTSIYSLIKLNHLDMSFNPLCRISANAARLINLNCLDLSNTDIQSIPAELLTLAMTTIKTENCTLLQDRSSEIDQQLKHNPLSLRESCARQLIQPILYDVMTRKQTKRKKCELKKLQKQQQLQFQQLPRHLIGYLSQPKACSSCGGPYYDNYVVRYRIVQRQDESWVPVEYRLCSAHWNTEKERLLTLFSEEPHTSLPPTTEPCHLKLIPTATIALLEHSNSNVF